MIDHASYVITDSFLATCFSLLFLTKFWVFVESNSMSKPNSRIYNILKIADCQERILTNETVNRVDVDADIDFSVSDTNIESYSLLSKKYLDKALL